MPRILLCTVFTLLLAPAAQATVSVQMESLFGDFYYPGGTITLEVLVTANAGEKDDTAFGGILYDSSRLTLISSSQNLLPGTVTGSGTNLWNAGQLSCTTVRCIAFSQVAYDPFSSSPFGPFAVNVTNFEIAELTFQQKPDDRSIAPLFFDWQSTPTTQRLDFFGVTSARGVCVMALVMDTPGATPCPIPEPGTAGLLALGLAALALACRSTASRLTPRSGSTGRPA